MKVEKCKDEGNDLKARTKEFALRVIHMYSALPKSAVAQVLGKQVLRSGTSVGANYRKACRARSKAEFVAKIGDSLKELDETGYWFELLRETGIVASAMVEPLQKECDELLAIFTTIAKKNQSFDNNRLGSLSFHNSSFILHNSSFMFADGETLMAKTATSYQQDLIDSLKDPCEAAAYLNAAIEEGDREVFLLALRNVAEANGGMGAVAEKANLSRESLYRMLSKKGNPEIKSLFTLLHSMGLRMAVEAEPHVCGAG